MSGSRHRMQMCLHRVLNTFVIALCCVMILSCSPSAGIPPTEQHKAVATPPVTPVSPATDPGYKPLFDGVTTNNWRMSTVKNQPGADPGRFVATDGVLEAISGNTLGLFWCTNPTPPDFILRLEWMTSRESDNSGVFIRFPNPEEKGYDNTANVGVDYGFEVQIDNLGRSDGAAKHKTGAIYNLAGPEHADRLPVHPPGQWNLFEIRVQGQTYTISLNGEQITVFHFVVGSDHQHPDRGLPGSPDAPRFIGLQAHPGSSYIYFRNIQIKAL